jgi:hypothetical protein
MAYGMEQPDPALSILDPGLELSTLGCSSTHNKMVVTDSWVGIYRSTFEKICDERLAENAEIKHLTHVVL